MKTPPDIRTAFGGALSALRHRKGWTQPELVAALAAEDVTVSPQTISGWENALYVPSLETVEILELLLGATDNELLTALGVEVTPIASGQRLRWGDMFPMIVAVEDRLAAVEERLAAIEGRSGSERHLRAARSGSDQDPPLESRKVRRRGVGKADGDA